MGQCPCIGENRQVQCTEGVKGLGYELESSLDGHSGNAEQSHIGWNEVMDGCFCFLST